MNSIIGKLPLRYFEIVSELPNSTVALTASAMARRGSSGDIRAYSGSFPWTAIFQTGHDHACECAPREPPVAFKDGFNPARDMVFGFRLEPSNIS